MDQLTRNQKTIKSIAQLLLALKPGDRIPPIQAINKQIKVGVGTVQKAMAILADLNAVVINARGHLGSFVDVLDYAQLWNLAGHGPVKLVLPNADAVEFKGLSEGINLDFEERGVRARIDHNRGARFRLDSVEAGRHDACIVSHLAFEQTSAPSQLDALVLDKVDYYQPDSVVVLTHKSRSRGPLRIGYDPSSLDHYLLTQSEFPEDKVGQIAVPCPYGHLLSALLAGAIDCCIWHRVDIGVSFALLPIVARPVERQETLSLLKRCEIACCVFRKDRLDVRNLLGLVDARAIRASQIAALDESVADRKILSSFIESLTADNRKN